MTSLQFQAVEQSLPGEIEGIFRAANEAVRANPSAARFSGTT